MALASSSEASWTLQGIILGGQRKVLGDWIAALVTLTGFYEAAAGLALPSVHRQGRVNVLGLK